MRPIFRDLISWNFRMSRRALQKKSAVIIMYHGVTGCRDVETNYFGKHVYIEDFREQIQFFSRNYNIISLEDLCAGLRSKQVGPDSLVITFDDGYRNLHSAAYPILKEYGIPATVFLITGLIGKNEWAWLDKIEYVILRTDLKELKIPILNASFDISNLDFKKKAIITVKGMLKGCKDFNTTERAVSELEEFSQVDCPQPFGNYEFLNWKHVVEMNRNRIAFGAHTVNHPILSHCDLIRGKQEILDSKMTIESKLGQKSIAFCYPNGKLGDYTNQIKEFCRDHFYCALSANIGTVSLHNADLYDLRRIAVSSKIRFSTLLRFWRL